MSGAAERSRSVRLLTAGLAVVLVIAVAGVVAIAVAPIPLESGLTELALLGPNGTASGYPTNLSAGESGTVTVVVENREHRETTYTLLVRADGETLGTRTLTLADGGTWREEVTFTVPTAATTRIEFALYRGRTPDPGAEPYRLAYVSLDGTAAGTGTETTAG